MKMNHKIKKHLLKQKIKKYQKVNTFSLFHCLHTSPICIFSIFITKSKYRLKSVVAH